MASNVIDNLPKSGNCNQYCLKWNNHKLNISGVFERLRANEQFCDLTLTSADQRFVKCHRILLCAGSGYLEEILTQNQSDHPTVILSQINYAELRLLVEFTYNGEVSVESTKLAKLLEAAKILKIKGLWESETDDVEEKDEEERKPETEETKNQEEPEQPPSVSKKSPIPDIATLQPQNVVPQLVGSRKRKRKSLPSPIDTKSFKPEEEPKSPGVLTPKSETGNSKVYSPMFGVSNAYFLTAPEPKNLQPINSENAENKLPPTNKILNDLPNLTPIHPALITAMSNAAPMPFLPFLNPLDVSNSDQDLKKKVKKEKIPDKLNLTDASGRKYKQYTEETLQQALRDIMEGQSINRSSMKYNIPARTLRDWMKRLNIKSVFTHNHGSNSPNQEVKRNMSTESDCSSTTTASRDGQSPIAVVDALPCMTIPMQVIKNVREDLEEEEIDDDEENIQ